MSNDIRFTTLYTPPASDKADLRFVPQYPVISGAITASLALAAALSGAVRPPDPVSGALSANYSLSLLCAASGLYDNAVNRLTAAAYGIRHETAQRLPALCLCPWQDIGILHIVSGIPHAGALPPLSSVRDGGWAGVDIPWGLTPHCRTLAAIGHTEADHLSAHLAAPFAPCVIIHTMRQAAFQAGEKVPVMSGLPFITLSHLHRQEAAPYGQAPPLAFLRVLPSGVGIKSRLSRLIPWQEGMPPRFAVASQPYIPPAPPPRVWSADLWFSRPVPSLADLIFGIEIIYVPIRRVYLMINNASLVRLPDRTPLDATNVKISIDTGSWCWSFSATLSNKSSLALVMPDAAGNPVSVEADMNGWKWVCMIEGWQENRAFGSNSWTISGRSLSAQFADPYAPLRSSASSVDRNAQQLVADELANTGWTLVWNAVDWLVTAGAYSYHDQTPMQAMQRVVQAIGAIIQTDPYDTKFVVQPRYTASPWNWAALTPVISLPDAVISTLGRQWEIRPRYDAVFVSGESQGVVAHGIRTGMAGNNPAPSVTDALITHIDAGRERARNILSAGGRWDTSTIAVPLLAAPDAPGLVLPGAVIEVVESGVAWRGQVIGTSVAAQWSQGVNIMQTLEVERWYG